VHVVGLDHLVLRVADPERTLAWYVDELGLAPERVDAWRRGEVPFPSVRVDATTIIDLLPAGSSRTDDGRGALDHFCLVVAPADVEAVVASARFDVLEGPVTRFGAQGDGTSVYVRDPDGVVVELRCYSAA